MIHLYIYTDLFFFPYGLLETLSIVLCAIQQVLAGYILDTGTSKLVGPSSDILNIQQAIGATQNQYGEVSPDPYPHLPRTSGEGTPFAHGSSDKGK